MSDEQKYTIQGLDEYIRQGEPQQRERVHSDPTVHSSMPVLQVVC